MYIQFVGCGRFPRPGPAGKRWGRQPPPLTHRAHLAAAAEAEAAGHNLWRPISARISFFFSSWSSCLVLLLLVLLLLPRMGRLGRGRTE